MEKYEVRYYHHLECKLASYFCIAQDEDEAEQIFAIAHPEHYKLDAIDEIVKYEEPRFHTGEEILGNRGIINE